MANWNGKFDIAFAGATINCNTTKKITALQNYIQNADNTFMVPLNNCSTVVELQDSMLYNTTYFHESRHVHDYLLCPILNYGYRLRLLAVLHGLQVLLKWEIANSAKFNILPIPIQKWFRLDGQEKQDYIKDWSNSTFTAHAPDINMKSPLTFRNFIENSNNMSGLDDLTSLLIHASSYYEIYSYIHKPGFDVYGREYSVKTLLEASAMVSQVASAEAIYGKLGVSTIVNLLDQASQFERGPQRRFTDYTVILSYVGEYLRHNASIGYENLFSFTSYLINWCFSGNLMSPGALTSPGMRLNKFIENDFAKKIRMDNIEEDPISVYHYWDSLLGCEGLDYHEYFSSNRRVYEEIADKAKYLGYGYFANYVEMINKATQVMMSLFFKNPRQYLNPFHYISHFHDYVNIPARFELSEPIPMVKSENSRIEIEENLKNKTFSDKDHIVHSITIDRPFIQTSKEVAFKCSQYDILSYKTSDKFRDIFLLVEMLFKEQTIIDVGTLYNKIFGTSQIRYIF